MKPIMLFSPKIQAPPIESAIRLAEGNSLGEIDNRIIDPSLWKSSAFFDYLHTFGYRPRKCKRYDSLSLTFVNGSCRWHTDPGFGLVACWLLHSDNDFGDDAQLVTRFGPTDMAVGDLCVFDSDQGHAWLSNGICVMVMATVSRLNGR
jgi:hypothetical protein